MPTPTTSGAVSTFTPSGTNDLDALLDDSGTIWGQPASVSYSFPSIASVWDSDYSSENEPATLIPLTSTQMQAARNAFAQWDDVAKLSFKEIPESSSLVGDFRFGFSQAVTNDGSWGWARYPDQSPSAGDVWISTDYKDASFRSGDYDFMALMHEIGHGLGLKHPGNYNGDSIGQEPGPFISKDIDNIEYTIMSYGQDPINSQWGGMSAQTPMVYDIKAIQYLYGANTLTRTGNDAYTFSSSSPNVETIWDAGGSDTINASGITGAVKIDLRQGHYSSIGLIENIGIAFNVTIENAIGGGSSDSFYGNEVGNIFTGGAGKDTFVFIDALDAVNNLDHITDFTPGSDVAYLGTGVFSKYSTPGTDLANDFVSGAGAVAKDSTDHFLYDSSTGVLSYDADGNGNNAAVAFAILDSAPQLSASDLEIVGSDATNSGDTETVADGYKEIGDNSSESFIGSDKNDRFWGEGGNDDLLGNDGEDTLSGGDGNDWADGGNGNDNVWGGIGKDELYGGAGEDLVDGEDGNDTVYGGDGADDLWGERGNDILYGGNGDDFLFGDDYGIEYKANDTLDGGDGNDNLDGGDGTDKLIGGLGNDGLDGGKGNDQMAGGDGNDTYYVDSKKDTVTEKIGEGTIDMVVTTISYTLGNEVEMLWLNSDNGLTGIGNKGDNDITGGGGRDTLNGKDGNDKLYGDLGADKFVFDTQLNASTNVDTIDDFVSGEDAIYLSKKIFAAYKTRGAIADEDFGSFTSTGFVPKTPETAATTATTHFIYDIGTGDLYYDKDGSGSAEAIKFVTLSGQPDLSASDLVIV